jgi:ferredoxin
MCEICKKHGDGGKWYFNPKNYSREMGEARKEFLEKIAGRHYEEWIVGGYEIIERLMKVPVLDKLAMNLTEKYEERMHGGQIIPLEESLRVLELCENPAILPCPCRGIAGNEKYCCLNFGLIPELYEKANPSDSIEEISVNKAKRLLTKWNKEGMYHLILWSKAPYVTTICNCTNIYCTGYKERYTTGIKTTLIKSEFIAKVNPNTCNGCQKCLTRCQFGAILFNLDDKKAFVDIGKCFGCGLCKTGCSQGAIVLIERKLTPAKNQW